VGGCDVHRTKLKWAKLKRADARAAVATPWAFTENGARFMVEAAES